jgi:hypothetical protein
VRVTVVPEGYASVQSVPQVMPIGDEKTVPPTGWVTVRVYGTGDVFARDALQEAVVPPLEPIHDHVQGPVP